MLVINNIEVSQNEDGLYSLVDLWKSTSNKKNKSPSKWLDLKGTESKIEYLCLDRKRVQLNQQVTSKNEYGYTYVCKELVYSYAMWISDKYHFEVIHAFDALVQGDIDTAVKIAVRSVMINKAGSEFDRLASDDNAVGEKAMNAHSNASNLYDRHSAIAGSDLASCRGKKAKRKASEDAIRKRSQFALSI